MTTGRAFSKLMHVAAISSLLVTSSCAWVDAPDARNVNIPSPTSADARRTAVNERPDSVMYLPLGEDVLVPEVMPDDELPHEIVGPFELRGETLAGALQLVLADYDISLAFETEEGLSRRVTVANLRGDLTQVVDRVCSLANLYCAYENGSIIVKDTQTFTVTLPPIGNLLETETDFLDNVAQGLSAIIGSDVPAPIVDPTTRTIIYSATQRTAEIASRYFQRLRANTAMIVFETYIWEVALNSGNSTGIQWDKVASLGKFQASIDINGTVGADFLNPVTIGLPTTSELTGNPSNLVNLLSQFGAVKTISQPQITMLSGAQAELRVADTRNYVSQIATTLDQGQATTSVNTDSVDTGFTLTIGSSWDKSTVYANVNIELTDVQRIDDFSFSDGGTNGASTKIQLPQTSERQLQTHIRVRPGDAVLIAGLVRENDRFDSRGIGFMAPILPDSRTAQAGNLELVILLRPRVIIYTASNDKRFVDYATKKHQNPNDIENVTNAVVDAAPVAPLQLPEGAASIPVTEPKAIMPPAVVPPRASEEKPKSPPPAKPVAPANKDKVSSATTSSVAPVDAVTPVSGSVSEVEPQAGEFVPRAPEDDALMPATTSALPDAEDMNALEAERIAREAKEAAVISAATADANRRSVDARIAKEVEEAKRSTEARVRSEIEAENRATQEYAAKQAEEAKRIAQQKAAAEKQAAKAIEDAKREETARKLAQESAKKKELELARKEADLAKQEAAMARKEAELAKKEADVASRQIRDMEARAASSVQPSSGSRAASASKAKPAAELTAYDYDAPYSPKAAAASKSRSRDAVAINAVASSRSNGEVKDVADLLAMPEGSGASPIADKISIFKVR
jgi:hypothetical protein